jgi:hypothetical protein
MKPLAERRDIVIIILIRFIAGMKAYRPFRADAFDWIARNAAAVRQRLRWIGQAENQPALGIEGIGVEIDCVPLAISQDKTTASGGYCQWCPVNFPGVMM